MPHLLKRWAMSDESFFAAFDAYCKANNITPDQRDVAPTLNAMDNTGEARATVVKRTPLKPISKKRSKVNVERRKAQEAGWGPRPWKCRFWEYEQDSAIVTQTSCFGPVNGHEILSRAQSGKDSNLTDVSGQVPLCDFHNRWVTEHPELAHSMGLLRHSWE